MIEASMVEYHSFRLHVALERQTPRRTVAGGLTACEVVQRLHYIAWSVKLPLLSSGDVRYVIPRRFRSNGNGSCSAPPTKQWPW